MRSVASGQAVDLIDSSYWNWHRESSTSHAQELADPQLERHWDELGRIHGELLVVAESCLIGKVWRE